MKITTKTEIEQILQPLIGLPLTRTTRSDVMQFFHFGKASITNNSGLILDVGVYTLAVQNGWKIGKDGKDMAKSDELFMPKELFSADGFDWKVPGSSFGDQRLKHFIKHNADTLTVSKIEGSETGELSIIFSENALLQIYSADERIIKETDGNTFWRFFSNINPDENFIYNSAVM
jgi:hypothetical protein